LALGKTVSQLLAETSSRELSEWMAYYNIEPFGGKRADLQAATVVQAVLLPHIKKGKKAPTLKECCLKFERPKPMSQKSMKDLLKGFTRNLGGVIKKK